jgi:hypothetical protein
MRIGFKSKLDAKEKRPEQRAEGGYAIDLESGSRTGLKLARSSRRRLGAGKARWPSTGDFKKAATTQATDT